MEQSYFLIIPEAVMQAKHENGKKLNTDAKLLYGVINSLTKKYGYCTASNAYLGQIYDCHEITISNYIAELKELGLIRTFVDRENGNKRKIWTLETMAKSHELLAEQLTPINQTAKTYKPNDLDLLAEPLRPLSQTANKLNKSISITSSKYSNTPPTPSQGSETPKSSSSKLTKAETQDFEELWKLYPKKAGKKPAMGSYRRAIRQGVTNKEIQDGILAYRRKLERDGTEQQYIKNGSTWFNQQGWEDEYSVSVSGKEAELDRLAAQYGDF